MRRAFCARMRQPRRRRVRPPAVLPRRRRRRCLCGGLSGEGRGAAAANVRPVPAIPWRVRSIVTVARTRCSVTRCAGRRGRVHLGWGIALSASGDSACTASACTRRRVRRVPGHAQTLVALAAMEAAAKAGRGAREILKNVHNFKFPPNFRGISAAPHLFPVSPAPSLVPCPSRLGASRETFVLSLPHDGVVLRARRGSGTGGSASSTAPSPA